MDYQITPEWILGLVINLLFTAAIYMGPLLIYRFLIYKNRLPIGMARKVCIISGIILYVILLSVYYLTETEGSPNMVADVLWTSIAYRIIREGNSRVTLRGDFKTQICEYVKFYKKMYKVKNKDLDDELAAAVDELFVQVIPFLNLLPLENIQKEMKKTKMNVEGVTLNIINNFAMMIAKENITGDELISGLTIEAEAAISVYRYVNEIKLEKKYISQDQYDENERLITAIRYNAPFI